MNLKNKSKKELEKLLNDINIEIEIIEEKEKISYNNYYLHIFMCEISEWEIEKITFESFYDSEVLTEKEFIEDKYNEPYIENTVSFGSGEIEVSIYTNKKKITIEEKNTLEELFLEELLKFKEKQKKHYDELLKKNNRIIEKELKNILRIKKLENIIHNEKKEIQNTKKIKKEIKKNILDISKK